MQRRLLLKNHYWKFMKLRNLALHTFNHRLQINSNGGQVKRSLLHFSVSIRVR